jgi:hypothetical protein
MVVLAEPQNKWFDNFMQLWRTQAEFSKHMIHPNFVRTHLSDFPIDAPTG